MRGISTNLLLTVLLLVVSLVVAFGIIHQTINPTTTGYLGLPDGVWIELESADTKTFVFPPVLWFGEELELEGNEVDYKNIYNHNDVKEFILSRNTIYNKYCIGCNGPRCSECPKPNNRTYRALINVLFHPSEFGSLLPLNGVLFGFKTPKSTQPHLAFYPLVTDNFGVPLDSSLVERDSTNNLYYFKNDENYGKINITLKFDLEKLKGYYDSKGYSLGADENEWKKNIKIGDDTLKELETNGNCSNIRTKEYSCSFEEFTVDKCCESSVIVEPPEIKVNLSGANYNTTTTMPIQPISFRVVYYADKLNDTDYIFNNYEEVFSRYEDPMNIYPCRSIVPAKKFNLLRNKKGISERKINWTECKNSDSYIRLKYRHKKENSTWYCKDNGDEYFLYNPYGFCKLVHNSEKEQLGLPSFPSITYLQKAFSGGRLGEQLSVTVPYWWGHTADIKIPDTDHFEAASVLSQYVIKKSRETLTDGGEITLFDPFTAGGEDVYFKFS